MSAGLTVAGSQEVGMSTLDYTIEPASGADLDDVLPLFAAYRRFFAPDGDERASRAFLAQRFEREESVVFLARCAGTAAGFLQLYPLWSSWYCRRIWFLSDLYVAQADRKRGVGGRLVRRALQHARETGASSVMVELPRREPHLTAFYAALGFQHDPVFDLARHALSA